VDVGFRPFDLKRPRPLILAESEDEAYAISLEQIDVDTLSKEAGCVEDSRLYARVVRPWSHDEPIAAFDYFNARRLVVVQSAEAWAAHYERPLVLRVRAEISCRRWSPFFFANLWYGAQEHSVLSQYLLKSLDCDTESERRKFVAEWVRGCDIAAREVERAAREHAARYLPAPLHKGRALSRRAPRVQR
jgi:hypothetical protein